jgi:hypothetical protein
VGARAFRSYSRAVARGRFVVGFDGHGPANDALVLGELLAAATGGLVATVCVFDDRRASDSSLKAVRAVSDAVSDLVAEGVALEGSAVPAARRPMRCERPRLSSAPRR